MMFTRRFLLAFLGLSNVWNLQAFVQPRSSSVPRKVVFVSTRRLQTTSLHAEKKNRETIVFACDLTFTCDPLPDNIKVEDMAEFLKGEECRRLLLSAGGTRAVEKLQVTPDLQGMWTEACDGFFFSNSSSLSLPKEPDEFMSTDAVIPFPGITLTNTVVNGITRMEDEKEKGGLPKYLFVLVGEKKSVEGPKPLVWLFNKMTGVDDNKNDEDADTGCYSKPKGYAVTYSSIINNKDGALAFNVDVRLQIVIEFPRYVMRLLPASKEKMEQQGSNACARAVSKDVELAVRKVREAFLTWHQVNCVSLQ
jgi:hypothetical protein